MDVKNMVDLAHKAYRSLDALLFIKNLDSAFHIKRDWSSTEIEIINRIKGTIVELLPMLPLVSNDLKAKLKEIDND